MPELVAGNGVTLRLEGSSLYVDVDAKPTLIYDRAGMEAIALNPTGWYRLAADIDMSGSNWTTAITFGGVLDGDGHVISGLTVGAGGPGGLFVAINGNAAIRRLGLENVSINNGNGSTYKGALLGVMTGGSVTDCYATGTVNTGGDRAGGLIGYSTGVGVISQCWCAVALPGGGARVGGLRGWGDGFNFLVGGCFWDTTLHTGGGSPSAGTGLSTAQMKTQSNFNSGGYNFNAVWEMPPGEYPALQ